MPSESQAENPLLQPSDLPFGAPPLDRIQAEHFLPAFEVGLRQQSEEIRAIVEQDAAPDFDNTIVALETSGATLGHVRDIFFNLRSAHTNDAMQEIAREITPRLSAQRDEILFNAALFQRVDAVWQRRDHLQLSGEQRMLLEETHSVFTRGGAGLSAHGQEQLGKIHHRLSVLSVRFSENVLAETQAFELKLDQESDLAGLPAAVRSAAAEEARRRGHDAGWVFTLDKPSWIPFLQYGERRELRQKLYLAYQNRCSQGDHDNRPVVEEIARLRARRAAILGYPNHAAYRLEKNMAARPEGVDELLRRLWRPALDRAEAEASELQQQIHDEGETFELQAWDWWFYAERLRKARYDFDDEELRPYFQLDAVRRGIFQVAERLFGLRFVARPDLPVYHQEVTAYEVTTAEGHHVGLFYTDDHPRPSKQVGAWMDTFRDQWREDDRNVRPQVVNVCNLARPTGDRPALLSSDEVTTLFHEFGHALHGLLADSQYRSLSGTHVPRDFVELPSQLMENWAFEPEVLADYAHHYATGKPIPAELVEKMNRAQKFNQGFATVEYLAASFLDLAWHTLDADAEPRCAKLESQTLQRLGLPGPIAPRYRSPFFSHVFSSGYDAGYYSYIWSEVLDADAFEAFRERGLFDQATAEAYRRHILSAGHSEPPMELYRKFRGAEPEIEPLLRRRGLQS